MRLSCSNTVACVPTTLPEAMGRSMPHMCLLFVGPRYECTAETVYATFAFSLLWAEAQVLPLHEAAPFGWMLRFGEAHSAWVLFLANRLHLR